MFEFKITLDENDYLLYNHYHLLNSSSGKKNLLYFRLIIPLICFMLFVILLLDSHDFQLIFIAAIILTITSVLWIVFIKKMIYIFIKSGMKKLKKEGKLPYSNESILKFDDEIIHETTQDTENKTKYSMVEKVAVTEKAIYIYVSSVQAYILPITAFSGDEEKQKFLDFLNLKVNMDDKRL